MKITIEPCHSEECMQSVQIKLPVQKKESALTASAASAPDVSVMETMPPTGPEMTASKMETMPPTGPEIKAAASIPPGKAIPK